MRKEADAVLDTSQMLAGLDLRDRDDADRAIELLKKDTDSVEWWALWMGIMVTDLRTKLGDDRMGEVVLSSLRLQAARSMLVFKQGLEEHVWTGYQQSRLIYDIAAASASTPSEAEAIQALRPIFEGLSEDVLHTWVEAEAEIGPRIGVRDVEEPLLKGLATYQLSLLERRRQNEELGRQHRARLWSNRLAAAGVGVALAGVAVAILKAVGAL
jgi:hypothetical protein